MMLEKVAADGWGRDSMVEEGMEHLDLATGVESKVVKVLDRKVTVFLLHHDNIIIIHIYFSGLERRISLNIFRDIHILSRSI